MTRRLFWRREPREAVRPRWTAALAARSRPVPLPTVLHLDAAQPAPHVLASATGQPTPDGYHADRPPRTVNHVGATEDFGDELHAMREDLAHGAGSLDPDDIAWAEAFAAAEAVIEREAAEGRYRLHKACDAFAPGWRGEPPVPVADFAEARKLATGEMPACEVAT